MASAESPHITETSRSIGDDGWTNLIFAAPEAPPRYAFVMFNADDCAVFGSGPYDEEQVRALGQKIGQLSQEEQAILDATPLGYDVSDLDFTINGDYPGGLEHAARMAAALILATGDKETS